MAKRPVKKIIKGDALTFVEHGVNGFMIVLKFDYGNGRMPGSAPRAMYGRCIGAYYGDFAPSTNEYYKATKKEIKEFFKNAPKDKLFPSFYMDNYPEIMGRYKEYITK